MTTFRGLVRGLCAFGIALSAWPAQATPVGVTTHIADDEGRDRHIRYELFYPAAAGARTDDETHTWVFTRTVARDADLEAGPPRRPLVLLSHGHGGTRFDLAWLAETLVDQGYLVASVEHPKMNYYESPTIEALQVWNRPQDLTAVLDHLADDAAWSSRIDWARIGAAGHSVGGYTVLAAAGARYNFHNARRGCARHVDDPTCQAVKGFDFSQIDYTHSRDDYSDPRIRAVIAFAPAVGEAADPPSARSVAIPVMVVGSVRDKLALYETHAQRWASLIGAELVRLDEGNHYTYVTPCNWLGRLIDVPACRSNPGLDKRAAQAHLSAVSVRFFSRHLSNKSDLKTARVVPRGERT